MYRSSHRGCSVKKGEACNFVKKRLQRRCFPVKFAKPLRTPILKNICERLLLNVSLFRSLCYNYYLIWNQDAYQCGCVNRKFKQKIKTKLKVLFITTVFTRERNLDQLVLPMKWGLCQRETWEVFASLFESCLSFIGLNPRKLVLKISIKMVLLPIKCSLINSFMTHVHIMQKPEQINRLVSI